MTKEELFKSFEEELADDHPSPGHLLGLVDQYVAEVIGKDDADLAARLTGMETSRLDTRNQLRAEQRKRAGL